MPTKIKVELKLIPKCDNKNLTHKLVYAGKSDLKNKLQKNQSSLVVYSIKHQVLIPGDSPKSEEKKWNSEIYSSRILILGHHGSKTSTSKMLLDSLKNLKMAVASARFNRYKHPSLETVIKLKKRKTPLLKTEQWGNLIFY